MAIPFFDEEDVPYAALLNSPEYQQYFAPLPAEQPAAAVPDDFFFNSGFAAATPQATGKPFKPGITKIPDYAGFADAGAGDVAAEEAAAFGFPQSKAVPVDVGFPQPTSTVTPAGFPAPARIAPIPYQALPPEEQLQVVAPTIPAYANPERDKRLQELEQEIGNLNKSQGERLKTAKTKPRISGDQALISVVGSLLPLIVGYAAAKKKGALMGLEAGGQFGQNYLKQIGEDNKETQALAAGEYTAGLSEAKDLQTQRRALQTQDLASRDDFGMQYMKHDYDSRKLEDQQRQQNELADKRFAAQEGLTDKRLAASEAASATRQAQGEQKAGEISSRPYNLALDKQQQQLVATELQVKPVLALMDKLDPKGEETLGGAIARGVKARVFKDSDEAQLQRDQMMTVFKGMKALFGGQLSDSERMAAERAQGGDTGVPIGTLRKILKKMAGNQYEQYNTHVDSLKKAGYQINFDRSENPFAGATGASAQSAPNQPASVAPVDRSQFDLSTPAGKKAYLQSVQQNAAALNARRGAQ